MKRLAERDAERERARQLAEQESSDRREARLPNETAYDRRKTTAVYTQDGRRGHHMGHYIPKEVGLRPLSVSGRGYSINLMDFYSKSKLCQ